MKITKTSGGRGIASLLLLSAASLLIAPGSRLTAADKPAPTVSHIYDTQFSGVESEIVSLAEAMPADKYDFAPTQGEFKGVRTFALQVRHIATFNYEAGAVLLGEKNPVDVGQTENGSDALKSKEQIVKYLKDSFAYCHKGMATLTAGNVTELIDNGEGHKSARGLWASYPIGHGFDHYGQMVVYARMNGVIPPASQ